MGRKLARRPSSHGESACLGSRQNGAVAWLAEAQRPLGQPSVAWRWCAPRREGSLCVARACVACCHGAASDEPAMDQIRAGLRKQAHGVTTRKLVYCHES
jgi:hypothetical protein